MMMIMMIHNNDSNNDNNTTISAKEEDPLISMYTSYAPLLAYTHVEVLPLVYIATSKPTSMTRSLPPASIEAKASAWPRQVGEYRLFCNFQDDGPGWTLDVRSRPVSYQHPPRPTISSFVAIAHVAAQTHRDVPGASRLVHCLPPRGSLIPSDIKCVCRCLHIDHASRIDSSPHKPPLT